MENICSNVNYLWCALISTLAASIELTINAGIAVPAYSINLFLPTIIKNMGYANSQSQLMSAPPFVVACIAATFGGYIADRLKQRGPCMMFFGVVSMAGFITLISTPKPHVQYFGIFLVAVGWVL